METQIEMKGSKQFNCEKEWCSNAETSFLGVKARGAVNNQTDRFIYCIGAFIQFWPNKALWPNLTCLCWYLGQMAGPG